MRDRRILPPLEHRGRLFREQIAARVARSRVRAAKSAERAHPMGWSVKTLTVLWYATAGKDGPHVQRDRPWYTQKVCRPSPTCSGHCAWPMGARSS